MACSLRRRTKARSLCSEVATGAEHLQLIEDSGPCTPGVYFGQQGPCHGLGRHSFYGMQASGKGLPAALDPPAVPGLVANRGAQGPAAGRALWPWPNRFIFLQMATSGRRVSLLGGPVGLEYGKGNLPYRGPCRRYGPVHARWQGASPGGLPARSVFWSSQR